MAAHALYKPSTPFLVIMTASALVLYLLLTWTGRNGLAVAAGVALLASPVMMAIINHLEKGTLGHMFNPALASWTFEFGDLVAVPWAIWWAARAWQQLPRDWYAGPSWLVVCALIGLAAGILFHMADAGAYAAQDALAQFHSRSKYWHDFVVYPVLLGGSVYLLWPVLRYIWVKNANAEIRFCFWMAMSGAVLWLALAALDAAVHQPKAVNMHPPGKAYTASK